MKAVSACMHAFREGLLPAGCLAGSAVCAHAWSWRGSRPILIVFLSVGWLSCPALIFRHVREPHHICTASTDLIVSAGACPVL